MQKKRYAQVGVGGRAAMFRDAVNEDFSDQCELTGLCDSNPGRLAFAHRGVLDKHGQDVPTYEAMDFDRMITETRPDCVIVTTVDAMHDFYICRAMELGCDVITEKPMTTDAEKCARILGTQKRTGREVRVTFNYRYSPPRTQVKELLLSGEIGEVLSVDFEWNLNTHHGADYFRRWHRNKRNSGGLLVHKATHHFDLVNWWLGTVPEKVYATGRRAYYLPEQADALGLHNRGERCHRCPEAGQCMFFLDIEQPDRPENKRYLRHLYLDCEKHDGYIRDRCPFGKDIDIEDSMQVAVEYRNGVRMSYGLNAFCAWEGYMIAFNGTKGRLEHKCQESVYINSDGTVPGALKPEATFIRTFPLRDAAYEHELWPSEGGHGGGDLPLLRDVFDANVPADKYIRAANQNAGAWSILTGLAANHSIETGEPVRIADIIEPPPLPAYP